MRAELRRREDEYRIRAAALERRDLRLHVGIGRLVADRLDDQIRFRAKPFVETVEIVLTVIVILIDDADLRIGIVLQQVLSRKRSIQLDNLVASRSSTGTWPNPWPTSSHR